jgi:hypothetical protein
MQENEYLKPSRFMKYASRHFMNTYYLNMFDQKFNFTKNLKVLRLSDHDKAVSQIISDPKLFKQGVSDADKLKTVNKAKEELKKQEAEDVDKTLSIVFNQTLVSEWGIFDMYLTDCMYVIISVAPKFLVALISKSNKGKIKRKANESLDHYFNKIKEKYIEGFDMKSVAQKFECFEHLGFKKSYFFNFGKAMEHQYPDPYNYLMSINQKRRMIAHKNQLPLENFEDYGEIHTFLNAVVLGAALKMEEYFGCMCDFTIPIKYSDKTQYIKWT